MIVKTYPRVQSRLIVKVGPFCRKGLSPQGEPPWGAHPLHVAAWPSFRPRLVAGREVLLGKQDLPKSATAPPTRAVKLLYVQELV